MRRYNFRSPEFLALLNSTAGIVRASDLDHLWNMDEASGTDDAVDAVGGMDLTVFGSPAVISGQVNGARQCSVGSVFNRDGVETISGESFTVFGWFNFSGTETYLFLHGEEDGLSAFCALSVNTHTPGKISFETTNGISGGTHVESVADASGWFFAAGGWDAGTGKIWVKLNGGARVETIPGTFYSPFSGRFVIPSNILGIVVNCDQIGWKRGVLTDEQLNWIYNSGVGRPIV